MSIIESFVIEKGTSEREDVYGTDDRHAVQLGSSGTDEKKGGTAGGGKITL